MQFRLSDIQLLTNEAVQGIYIPVSKFAHKGSNGLGLLVAGSRNMPGAALLSAKAALRSGIGKLTVHAPISVTEKIALYVPEAILYRDSNSVYFSAIPDSTSYYNAIAIGPGLGKNPITGKGISELIKKAPYPIIIDADALNFLAENKVWLESLPQNSILTPHISEFDRLAGKSKHRFERLQKAKEFAQKYHVIVILKGHYTTIVLPDGNMFMNTTGNQGMATAGSGDVLTGILLGLLAKGYSPENSAKLGVYLHGAAGDCALEKQSHESLIASDIIENLGKAFKLVVNG
ncbi:MAG: NAD(P)H-hydrate dehydratase [Bacteroidales bacterium]|jgi:NAD(P)H-hydrate epimerase|nr:NAD(P)H-hydrate dehydratase [Bacteroidales bacterium]